MKKILKCIKELRWKNFKPKAEAAKIKLSSFGYWSIRFFQNKWSPSRV
jgi:hypothetical protein